jgi:hypothetical protein
MFSHISLNRWNLLLASTDRCHPIHIAGNLPNDMNRFLPTNRLEVLFVN